MTIFEHGRRSRRMRRRIHCHIYPGPLSDNRDIHCNLTNCDGLLLEGQTAERYDAAAVVVGATNVSVHCHRCIGEDDCLLLGCGRLLQCQQTDSMVNPAKLTPAACRGGKGWWLCCHAMADASTRVVIQRICMFFRYFLTLVSKSLGGRGTLDSL